MNNNLIQEEVKMMMLRLEGLKVGIENLMKSLKGDVIVSDVYDYEYDVKN